MIKEKGRLVLYMRAGDVLRVGDDVLILLKQEIHGGDLQTRLIIEAPKSVSLVKIKREQLGDIWDE